MRQINTLMRLFEETAYNEISRIQIEIKWEKKYIYLFLIINAYKIYFSELLLYWICFSENTIIWLHDSNVLFMLSIYEWIC